MPVRIEAAAMTGFDIGFDFHVICSFLDGSRRGFCRDRLRLSGIYIIDSTAVNSRYERLDYCAKY